MPTESRRDRLPGLPQPLSLVRAAIDRVDDGLLLLLAGRRQLAGLAAMAKHSAGVPVLDPQREAEVRQRGREWADRIGLPGSVADEVLRLAIADASSLQAAPPAAVMMQHLLRRLPPPRQFGPAARLLPQELQGRLLEVAMAQVLTQPLASGSLEFMRGRRLGIEVEDLGLAWIIEFDGQRLRACGPGLVAEATVRGSVTDLLLLASRREDADTLFFQRRLHLTGDTELGLTARNLLERLPWESVPPLLRMALDRTARLAQAVRNAQGSDRARASP